MKPVPTTQICVLDSARNGSYGEIIGGSMREEDHVCSEDGITWYGSHVSMNSTLTFVNYGTVPHGGFGIGIERMVTFQKLVTKTHCEAIPFYCIKTVSYQTQ